MVFAFACGSGPSCGGAGGCTALQPLPTGNFTGVRSDSAAAARITARGFGAVNSNADLILEAFAPGRVMEVPLGCTIANASLLGNLAVSDEGSAGCTAESCGLMDGRCDARDVPRSITVEFQSLTLGPKGPDQIEATIGLTLRTGKIRISSVSRALTLCGLTNPIKIGVDLDTARATPNNNLIRASIKLAVDTRWERLLSFQISQLDGASACASGQNPPQCIDGDDIVITSEGPGCGTITSIANIEAIKNLLLGQLTSTLREQLEKTLAEANCRPCGPGGVCPTQGVITSACVYDADAGAGDAGTCIDGFTGKCVPGIVGLEGRLDVGSLLGTVGAAAGSSLDLSIAAGGSAVASDAGVTVGFMGGAATPVVAACVKPLSEPTFPMLPLPDFERDAPGAFDVGLTVSQQLVTRALFHAQQSGALRLELGTEDVSLLDSSLVATLLPSLGKLTHGESVPMRVVIRPVNPPTAELGPGGEMAPLVTMKWNDVEIDLYALLEERRTRLFTLTADLALPLSLSLDGCATVTPVLGSLSTAVSDVQAKNSEILAEELDVLKNLVPSLLAFAEPSLAGGLGGFTLPAFGDFQLKLLAAKGVGQISGTTTFNHLGLYADLLPATQPCMAMSPRLLRAKAESLDRQRGEAMVRVSTEASAHARYSYRLANGFWSTWREAEPGNLLRIEHPRLKLGGVQQLQVRARDDQSRVTQAVPVSFAE